MYQDRQLSTVALRFEMPVWRTFNDTQWQTLRPDASCEDVEVVEFACVPLRIKEGCDAPELPMSRVFRGVSDYSHYGIVYSCSSTRRELRSP